MLTVEVYAEVMDRHVELAGDITWIGAILDDSYPPDDARRQRRARSSPATQIEAKRGGTWLADRLVVIVQLAEALDVGTLQITLELVPVEWWEERLRTPSAFRLWIGRRGGEVGHPFGSPQTVSTARNSSEHLGG